MADPEDRAFADAPFSIESLGPGTLPVEQQQQQATAVNDDDGLRSSVRGGIREGGD